MTLNDYAIEVHRANQKWWLDLEKPCERCKATGLDPVDESERQDNYSCSECKGFGYARKKRNLGEMLMLAVSELSEALEGHRKNLMDEKLPHRKMVEVELADCLIRLLDTAQGIGVLPKLRVSGDLNSIGFAYGVDFEYEENFGQNLLEITGWIWKCLENPSQMLNAITCLIGLCAHLNLDLEGAYQEKMKYNATRADHTIAGRLAEGGKAY